MTAVQSFLDNAIPSAVFKLVENNSEVFKWVNVGFGGMEALFGVLGVVVGALVINNYILMGIGAVIAAFGSATVVFLLGNEPIQKLFLEYQLYSIVIPQIIGFLVSILSINLPLAAQTMTTYV